MLENPRGIATLIEEAINDRNQPVTATDKPVAAPTP